MILCVDFGANSDCDCEECSYSPNYQGKWCFMNILSLCFLLNIRNILLDLHAIFCLYAMMGNPSSCRIAKEFLS